MDFLTNPIFWIVIVIVFLLIFLGRSYYRRLTMNKIMIAMSKQDEQQFKKVIDSFGCKSMFSPFDRECMRLDMYVLLGKVDKIREQFNLLLNMRVSKKEKADMFGKAFYFYVDEKDKSRAEEMLGKMKGYVDDVFYQQCVLTSDIELNHSTAYIETMEENVKGRGSSYDRGMMHYFLGLQYGYKGEKKKEREHLQIALKDMKDSPYEIKIKNLMGKK